MTRTHWLDLFTVETWDEFHAHGADVSGFSENRWGVVQRMKSGDHLLCYLTVESRWVGVLEVTGEPFYDESERIWKGAAYPARVPVKVIVALKPELGVPVLDTRKELSVFRDLKNPNKWMGPFRGSPTRWKADDAEVILRLLREAEENPTPRPLSGRKPKLTRRPVPTIVDRDAGALTLPDDEQDEQLDTKPETESAHTEIQHLLLKLGADMGFDVYVARNDQSRQWRGKKLGDMPRRRASLPQQFDPLTNATIELIDVLWLDGPAITAAFEVESTTSIYSGLLRMSDLLAMQPNISVPLFLVAPRGPAQQSVEGGQPSDVQASQATARRRVQVHHLRRIERSTERRRRQCQLPAT
jgi:hypothetical protein